MADRGMVYGGGDALNQKRKIKNSSSDYQPLDSAFASANSNHPFFGSSGIVSFGAGVGVNRSGTSYFQPFDQEENGDQYFDEYFNQSEKKRKLSTDQLEFLEKSFEAENKLEPERKTQLAKDLGLQPRQIAIWFQNRRARCKTKQLETDYGTLHASYTTLKNDYDILLKENEKLKTEVLHLKRNFRPSDATSGEAVADMISHDEEPKVAFKIEERNSTKSDVTNEDCSRLTEGIHSSRVESGDSSSHVFEPDQSDLSQIYHLPANTCCYGFPIEDHAFSFWSY
ncbi:hypothetical protein BUALT_Bualt07G0058700 [Buddleja alternifolia]|uniref:Homeobox-leucine zipper protein n=1 Tax=Buddleja alternifolia TaxID=168488 RepID=A0AAV6X8D9_9LAMI|nr:hypothetical protein BUALT_Bualt07G0058700 [Buddleja alternifolia]